MSSETGLGTTERRCIDQGAAVIHPWCFVCNGLNHLARDCLARRHSDTSGGAGSSDSRHPRRSVRCYCCGGVGHFASACSGTSVERRHQRQPPLVETSERGTAKCFGESGERTATCVGGYGVFKEHCARLLQQGVDRDAISMVIMSREAWQCEGVGHVRLQLDGGAAADVRTNVTTTKPLGHAFILGMDGIEVLGGVTINARGEARFNTDSSVMCVATKTVMGDDERDFCATYDPKAKHWTAAWKWAENKELSVAQNQVEAYSV